MPDDSPPSSPPPAASEAQRLTAASDAIAAILKQHDLIAFVALAGPNVADAQRHYTHTSWCRMVKDGDSCRIDLPAIEGRTLTEAEYHRSRDTMSAIMAIAMVMDEEVIAHTTIIERFLRLLTTGAGREMREAYAWTRKEAPPHA